MRQGKLSRTRKLAVERGEKFYFTGSPCVNGHLSPKYTASSSCQACTVEKAGKWLKANKPYVKKQSKKRYDAFIEGAMVRGARHRARREGLPFNLTPEYVRSIWPNDGCCPVFGFEMSVGTGKATDSSPSLDKIEPALGYIEGNVAVISHLANRLKFNIHEPVVFLQLASWLESVKGN